jgi:hypothetical protein
MAQNYTSNWTAEDRYEGRQEALKQLEKIKERRKGKKFKLIPHPTAPHGFIELEVKPKTKRNENV